MSKSNKSKLLKAGNHEGVRKHKSGGSRRATVKHNSGQQKTAASKNQDPVLFFVWKKETRKPVFTFDPPMHTTSQPSTTFLVRSGYELVGLAQAANDRGTAWITKIGDKKEVEWARQRELARALPELAAESL
jgi:hypothetical protein